MKKYLLLCMILLVAVFGTSNVMAKDGDAISLDGAMLIEGKTMLPLRSIFENLNAQVVWDSSSNTVTATKEDTKIIIKVNSSTATVNGEQRSIDVPAKIINNKVMVPVRFVSEILGAKVEWDEKNRTVSVESIEKTILIKVNEEPVKSVTKEKKNWYYFARFDEIKNGNSYNSYFDIDKQKLINFGITNNDTDPRGLKVGDWLYLKSSEGGYNGTPYHPFIYKIKYDGSVKEKIDFSPDTFAELITDGNHIYFLYSNNYKESEKLYKMDLDGTSIEPIITLEENESFKDLHIANGSFYYWSYEPDREKNKLYLRIYKLSLDGTQREELFELENPHGYGGLHSSSLWSDNILVLSNGVEYEYIIFDANTHKTATYKLPVQEGGISIIRGYQNGYLYFEKFTSEGDFLRKIKVGSTTYTDLTKLGNEKVPFLYTKDYIYFIQFPIKVTKIKS